MFELHASIPGMWSAEYQATIPLELCIIKRMFRQSTNQNHYPVFGKWWRHWTALTTGRSRRCWEEKTTRSNWMKFRLPLPTASTVYTPNAVRKLNRECFFLSLKRQVNSNPTTCSYIPKDYEKRSYTVSHWLKVLTTVTCHKFSPTDYRLPATFFLAID